MSATLARVLWSIGVAILTYILIYLIATVLDAIGLAQVGGLLIKFGAILAVLAGLAYFFGWHRGA